MIYTINNCIRAFGYTDFNKLIEDKGSIDGLKEYVKANGYADIAVGEGTELLLVDVNGKTWHTGCYGAVIEPPKPYLCFTSTGDSTIRMEQISETIYEKVIQYKINDGQWQTLDVSYSAPAVSLSDGDKMYLKSDDEIPMGEDDSWEEGVYKQFKMTGSIAASGNIMSLLNFSDTLPAYAFYGLFKGCSSLTQAPSILPATTLADKCYLEMFNGCTSLTQAPKLPATTLADSCYSNMFDGCSKLTQAPELPATALTMGCYSGMFRDCSSLTTAPVLPATTLADFCYDIMFSDCTSLTQAPTLPATTLVDFCYNAMFQRCTSLTQAPELPATTLADHCYSDMFNGCTKLNYVKAMFTNIDANALTSWLNGVSETGTFVKNSAATWSNRDAGIPEGWTVQTASPDK